MSKKFWIECFKKFLSFTIPTLPSVFAFFGLFFKDFEITLQSLGFIGFVLICCLCFSLTIFLEVTGMIKIIDDIGNQYLEKEKSDKSIYKFYKSYIKSLKIDKNKKFIEVVSENKKKIEEEEQRKKKDNYQNKFDYFSIGVNQKSKNNKIEISYSDFIIDCIQEISNVAICSTCEPILSLFDEKDINTKLPKTIICKNILELQKLIITKDRMNIVISFDGLIKGCFLICFDKKAIIKAQRMFESKYKNKYISLQSILISYFKEVATILAETSLTSLYKIFLNQTPKGTQLGTINITDINTSLSYINDLYKSDNIISVNNVCRIPELTSIFIYVIFSFQQAIVISDKLTT